MYIHPLRTTGGTCKLQQPWLLWINFHSFVFWFSNKFSNSHFGFIDLIPYLSTWLSVSSRLDPTLYKTYTAFNFGGGLASSQVSRYPHDISTIYTYDRIRNGSRSRSTIQRPGWRAIVANHGANNGRAWWAESVPNFTPSKAPRTRAKFKV